MLDIRTGNQEQLFQPLHIAKGSGLRVLKLLSHQTYPRFRVQGFWFRGYGSGFRVSGFGGSGDLPMWGILTHIMIGFRRFGLLGFGVYPMCMTLVL